MSRILIIEDEEMVRKATYDTVSVFYNVVAEAPSCEIAIEKFKSHSDIDIALLDVYLLDGTGIELYPKLSSINLSPVFIVTTAFQETEVAKQLIEDGAYDYINKPFSQAELHKMMGRAWYHKNWPHLEDVLDIRNRRFIERMYFLNFVIEQNKLKNRKTVISDIYGLFPELVDHIFVKKSLWD